MYGSHLWTKSIKSLVSKRYYRPIVFNNNRFSRRIPISMPLWATIVKYFDSFKFWDEFLWLCQSAEVDCLYTWLSVFQDYSLDVLRLTPIKSSVCHLIINSSNYTLPILIHEWFVRWIVKNVMCFRQEPVNRSIILIIYTERTARRILCNRNGE